MHATSSPGEDDIGSSTDLGEQRTQGTGRSDTAPAGADLMSLNNVREWSGASGRGEDINHAEGQVAQGLDRLAMT